MNYYQISEQELGKQSRIPLVLCGNSEEVFETLAGEMIDIIQANNVEGKRTVLICPVGPVGQYPVFVRRVNEERISLRNCWFFNMDEYLKEDGTWMDEDSSLSFRGFMERQVYSQIDETLLMPTGQRVFPNPAGPEKMDRLLEELGGADACFGGIGINGHLAFNEAREDLSAEEFADLGTRVVRLTPETRTSNAISERGGAIDAMPKLAVTIGIRQILAAKRVRIGVFREWHRSVVRRAAYGEVSAAFPATLLQGHRDAVIYINDTAARQPF